jgi:2'-5' RNA ligase
MPSLTQRYQANWQAFSQLGQTHDSLAQETRGFRRWMHQPIIAFIVPLEDDDIGDAVAAWQAALRPWFLYDPQPRERLHITLHFVGMLRRGPLAFLPHTWTRTGLDRSAERVRDALDAIPAFEVGLGPLNAFPNVLYAEIQDDDECLRWLRTCLRRALPLRARPPTSWMYLPHMTLAYWGQQAAAPLIDALAPYRAIEPLRLPVTRVRLTIYSRDLVLAANTLVTAREQIIADFPLQENV